MFERYTEKARRVIFFARYEASQFGSPEIEPEHLLLGIMRDDRRFYRWLPKAEPEAVRRQIENWTKGRKFVTSSVDLPLGDASKSVLFHAKNEADRTKSKYIGTEHLLLGLLQEDGPTAKLLSGLGADLDKLRTKFEAEAGTESESSAPSTAEAASLLKRALSNRVRLLEKHNWHWHKTVWKPRDIVVNRETKKVSFDLTLAEDTTNFELVKDGWKKDYCALCGLELFEAKDHHGTGYTNGRQWVCVECYDKFWGKQDFISGSYSDLT